jgi:hypothetical protein
MKLRLLLNIGSIDARRLGLAKTLEGEGWASPPDASPADAAASRGIKAAPLTASAQLPAGRGAVRPETLAGNPGESTPTTAPAPAEDAPADLDQMTKAELAEYAADLGIEGVTTDLTKADMIAKIEEASGGQ